MIQDQRIKDFQFQEIKLIMMVAHIIISGFVQGVGFRQYVKSKAIKLGLTGWVRNLPDGRVKAVFQGEKETIEKILTICKNGPFLSEVKDVNVAWKEVSKIFSDFQILH